MYKCETCNKPHEGTFATGRFCSRSCSNSFSTKNKRSEISRKVGEKLKGRVSTMKGISLKTGKPLELRKCLNCEKEIDARKSYCNRKCLMEFHRAAKTSFQNYRLKASFNFNVYDYPDYFNLQLIEEYGIYRAKNRGDNLEGIVRDHMLSVKEGFMNNIDPGILAHPANCALIQHRDNCSKNSKSSITIFELLDRIKEFEKIN